MGSRLGVAAAGAALVAAWLAALFGGAGTLRWREGWLLVAAQVLGHLLHRAHVARRNPAVLARRRQIGEGTRCWDQAWLAIFWPLMISSSAAAGLDVVRAGGTPLPPWAWLAGAALLGAGLAVSARAMAVNPFFEGTVRLQPGQVVVEAGP